MRRLVLLLLLSVAVLLHVVAADAVMAATYDRAAEDDFLARTNQARTAAGLGRLASSPDLVDVARRHSAEMAANARLYHSTNLGTTVTNWKTLAENVGRGGSVAAVQQAFMQSEPHRVNIVRPGFSEVGIGVTWAGPMLYVTVIFREPKQATVAAPAAPRPRPVPTTATPRPAAPAPAPAQVAAAPVEPPPTTLPPPTTTTTLFEPPPQLVDLASGAYGQVQIAAVGPTSPARRAQVASAVVLLATVSLLLGSSVRARPELVPAWIRPAGTPGRR